MGLFKKFNPEPVGEIGVLEILREKKEAIQRGTSTSKRSLKRKAWSRRLKKYDPKAGVRKR